MSQALDRSIERLLVKFPPKHPDRSRMRPDQRRKERERKTNNAPSVTTNGWQSKKEA